VDGGEPRKPTVELALLSLAMVLLYWAVVPLMVQDWYVDENYSHGFLIPAVSAYILWARRQDIALAARNTKPSVIGFIVCVLSLAAFVVGRAGAEFFLQRSSLVLLLLGSVLWICGWPVFRVAWGPLGFLFFMVPLPYLVYDSIAFPLKLVAARFATDSLFYLNVPVLREGNVIHLAHQSLEVADACSGIRSLVSLVALGVVYAYFTESASWKRLIIVISTIPIAIAANAFRVTGTGLLTHYVSPKAAEGFFHTFSGWLVFVVAFVLLFGVGSVLKLIGRRRARAHPAHL
jgi:exosortase